MQRETARLERGSRASSLLGVVTRRRGRDGRAAPSQPAFSGLNEYLRACEMHLRCAAERGSDGAAHRFCREWLEFLIMGGITNALLRWAF